VKSNPPKKEGICDKCGSRWCSAKRNRSGHQPSSETVHQKTAPLIGFYEKEGMFIRVNATSAMPVIERSRPSSASKPEKRRVRYVSAAILAVRTARFLFQILGENNYLSVHINRRGLLTIQHGRHSCPRGSGRGFCRGVLGTGMWLVLMCSGRCATTTIIAHSGRGRERLPSTSGRLKSSV